MPQASLLFRARLLALLCLSGLPPAAPVSLTTVAGSGAESFADGAASSAAFRFPSGVAVLPGGSMRGALAVADSGNHRVRLVFRGRVPTLAGSTRGFRDGVGEAALFDTPWDVAVWPPLTALDDPTVVVSDRLNSRLRVVALNGSTTTLAGSGVNGFSDGVGTNARFGQQRAIAVSPSGVLFVADLGNYAIRVVTRAGSVTTLAGSPLTRDEADGVGTNAGFTGVYGVLAASAGGTAAFAVDLTSGSLRRISDTGAVVTVMRGLGSSYGCESFLDGHIFISGTQSDQILLFDTADGSLSVVVGVARGDRDGNSTVAAIFNPIGLSNAFEETVYLADYGNQKIKAITGLGPARNATPSATPGASPSASPSAPPPSAVQAPATLSAGIIVLLAGTGAFAALATYCAAIRLRRKPLAFGVLFKRFASAARNAPPEGDAAARHVMANPIGSAATTANDPVFFDDSGAEPVDARVVRGTRDAVSDPTPVREAGDRVASEQDEGTPAPAFGYRGVQNAGNGPAKLVLL